MNQILSVIVPVYNVAAYLPECLDSLLSQDYEKLEVILIDDGATDHSGAICDRYAAEDSRIRVIHQKNGGAAAAKNTGLRAATGEYLTFLDADDYLEPNVYGYMLTVLKESGADVAEFTFRDVYRNRREDNVFCDSRKVVSGREYLTWYLTRWHCALLWNKVYKRSLFDGIFFEEGHKIDDEYFTYQGILNAQTVVCDNRIVYNYRRRRSSAMLSPQSQNQLALDRIDCISKRRRVVAERAPELRGTFDVAFLDALVYISEYPNNTEDSIRLLKSELKKYLKEGNTFPPKYLWRGLLRLRFTGTDALLKKFAKEQEAEETSDYFA